MIKYIVTLCMLVMYSSLTFAWDGGVEGKIQQLDITAGSNFGVRVTLSGVSTMCTGGSVNWAFLNDTDSNYKTYVAALLLAKAQGTTVVVLTTLEGSYCHIGYLTLRY